MYRTLVLASRLADALVTLFSKAVTASTDAAYGADRKAYALRIDRNQARLRASVEQASAAQKRLAAVTKAFHDERQAAAIAHPFV